MSRAVIIYYNDVDVFDNVPCPTPFVTRSNAVINFGKKFGQTSSITLDGVITGHNFTGVDGLYQKSSNVLSGFSQNFKNLKIVDTSSGTQTIFDNLVKVNSIDFQENTFARLVEFSINLEAYESGLFPANFGVLDPADNIDVSKTEDGQISISRTVSARGYNTSNGSSNALQNAINFVNSRTGVGYLNQYSLPHFIQKTGQKNLVLSSQSESINRFEATYSVEESYKYQELSGTDSDLYGSSLTYPIYKTCTFNFSPETSDSPREEASFNIEFSTNKGATEFYYLRETVTKYVNKLRENGVSSIQDSMVQEAVNNFNLSNGALFYQLSEDQEASKINLELNITNDSTFNVDYGVYFTENYSFNNDPIRDFTDINYDFTISPFGLVSTGTITYDNVPQAQRPLKRSYKYYYDNILGGSYGSSNLENYVSGRAYSGFTGLFTDGYLADKIKVIELSKQDNPSNGVISVSSTSTNSEVFKSGDIKNGSYSISVNAPIKIIKAARSSLNDSDYVITEYDTTYTRQDCDVSFDASYNSNKQLSASNLKNEINTNAKSFINKIKTKVTGENFLLVSENYDVNQFNGNASSSHSFSSKHTEDLYKVKVNPYLGSVN